MAGLYVHIPFCVSKCSYCDFYSLPGQLDNLNAYIEAVCREAVSYGKMSFTTLFIGGGTPSLLGAEGLARLMRGLKANYNLENLRETTLEANPESLSSAFLNCALGWGFNRISIGVQSLNDIELTKVGRVHNATQAVQALESARRAGFRNISADVILGLPGQDPQSLNTTLETLIGLELDLLSLYCLALEPHTPLALNPPADLPSDDVQADFYAEAVQLLERRGYRHYEISNFARPGYECRHNLNYWRAGDYVGLGPAAASHLKGSRYKNKADLAAYLSDPGGQREDVEKLNRSEKAGEETVLRLRLLQEGLDLNHLILKYGDRNVVGLAAKLNQLSIQGHLRRENSVYTLNPEKALISNSILAELVGE
jgi:putative oxygen-independent coproporphyrinogen III oxidase